MCIRDSIINGLSTGLLMLLRIDPNAKDNTMTEAELRSVVNVSHQDLSLIHISTHFLLLIQNGRFLIQIKESCTYAKLLLYRFLRTPLSMILSKIRLFSFSVRTEQNHFLFYFFNDCICTRFQKFTWIVSFSFKILSCFNVFAGSFCEYQLTFCINIDLRRCV